MAFARELGAGVALRLAMTAVQRCPPQVRKLGVSYEFLFMRASGGQLRQITGLIDKGLCGPSSAGSSPSMRLPRR